MVHDLHEADNLLHMFPRRLQGVYAAAGGEKKLAEPLSAHTRLSWALSPKYSR